MLCTGCASASYCNATCQRAHWKAHKPDCMAARPKDLDWTVDASHSLDLRADFRGPLKNTSFAYKLSSATAEVCRFTSTDSRPMPLDGALYKATMMTNSAMPLNHHIYLVSLDLVGYALCYEMLGGKARVWMAFMYVFTVGE